MADFNKPTVDSEYTQFPTEIRAAISAALSFLDGEHTNVPLKAKRWNSSAKIFEEYNGTQWMPMATEYKLPVDYNSLKNKPTPSSAINDESDTKFASSAAVKTAYNKGVEAKTAADDAQRSANDGINRANNAKSLANAANNNANGRVSKSGDTMTGPLNANSGVNTLNRGADGFDRQWQNSIAPYLVDNGNANGNNAYYPFIKGINRNGNTWGTAFSFGYETPDGINKFGRGCIHLIEDNGTQKLWRFEHNGDFVAPGDVLTARGKSLNNATQLSDFTYQKIGDFEVRKYPDGTMIQTYRFTPPNNRVGAQDKKFTFNWAVAFTEKPKVWIQHNTHESSGYGSLDVVAENVENECTATKETFWVWEWYYNNHLISFDFFAIGRWK